MDLTLSTAQPRACHYEAEEKNIRHVEEDPGLYIHVQHAYIHVLTDRQRDII